MPSSVSLVPLLSVSVLVLNNNNNLSLHSHHQEDSCIQMCSDESHFNVLFIVRDKPPPPPPPHTHTHTHARTYVFRLQGDLVFTVPAPLTRHIMPSSVSLVPSTALTPSLLSLSVSVLNLGISFARRSSPHSPSSASQTHYESSVSLVPSAASLLSLLFLSVPVLDLGISFARRASLHGPSSTSQTHYAIVCITSPISSITAIVIVSFCFSFGHWCFVCKEIQSSQSQLQTAWVSSCLISRW